MYLENLGRGRVEEGMPHVGGSCHIPKDLKTKISAKSSINFE